LPCSVCYSSRNCCAHASMASLT